LASEHLEQTLHIHYHPIVEDILILHGLGCFQFELTLYILFDLLATLDFFSLIFYQDDLDGFFDRLFVSLLSDLKKKSSHEIFQSVLQIINLLAILFDGLVTDNVLLDLPKNFPFFLFLHFYALHLSVLFQNLVCPFINFIYFSRHQLFTSLFKDWVCDFLGKSHYVVKGNWLCTRLLHDLELILVKDVKQLLVLLHNGVHFIFAEHFEHGGSCDS